MLEMTASTQKFGLIKVSFGRFFSRIQFRPNGEISPNLVTLVRVHLTTLTLEQGDPMSLLKKYPKMQPNPVFIKINTLLLT
jgi:hypothetical protein